jgi:hypothetical protein
MQRRSGRHWAANSSSATRCRAANEDAYRAVYYQHIDQVRSHFASRPHKLLEVCWENGDGWQQICDFLQKEKPEQTFPKVNTAKNRLDK